MHRRRVPLRRARPHHQHALPDRRGRLRHDTLHLALPPLARDPHVSRLALSNPFLFEEGISTGRPHSTSRVGTLLPSRCRALAKSPTDTLAHAVPELLSCMLQVMVPPVAAGNCR